MSEGQLRKCLELGGDETEAESAVRRNFGNIGASAPIFNFSMTTDRFTKTRRDLRRLSQSYSNVNAFSELLSDR